MNAPKTKASPPTTASDSSPQPSRSSTTLSGMVVGTNDNSASTFLPNPRRGNAKPPRTSCDDDGRRRRRRRHAGLPQSHPQPGHRAPPPASRKVKEYRLLQSQALLLAGTALLGFALFLLFTLPLAALVGLTVMVTSMGACLLVASSAAKAWYEIQLEHPLGLIRHLPPTARAYLTEKSLNEVLCPSASAESLPSLSSTLSRHNSSSRGSLSSLLPLEQHHHHQRRAEERVKIGDGRPPQASDAYRSSGHSKVA